MDVNRNDRNVDVNSNVKILAARKRQETSTVLSKSSSSSSINTHLRRQISIEKKLQRPPCSPRKKLYGRENELRSLQRCYDKLVSDNDSNNGDKRRKTPMKEVMFISGLSGSGKTALVYEFTKRLEKQKLPFVCMKGKFSDCDILYPFRAITDAIDNWCKNLSIDEVQHYGNTTTNDNDDNINVRSKLEDLLGKNDVYILVEFIPHLSRILCSDDSENNNNEETAEKTLHGGFDGNHSHHSRLSEHSSTSEQRDWKGFRRNHMNMKKLNYIFESLIQTLQSLSQCPIILFIDDLQWADFASLELLQSLLVANSSDRSSQEIVQFFFIGTYRSNEVHQTHNLTAIMNDIDAFSSSNGTEMQTIQLTELTCHDIGEYIADTLNLNNTAAFELARTIFAKTMGNINHTRQTLDQLVQKKILYRDSASDDTQKNCWRCSLTMEELKQEISDDVMEMIKAKIKRMPEIVQRAVVIASYIRTTFEVSTLVYCMNHIGLEVSAAQIKHALGLAVYQNLLVEVVPAKEFAFSHDSIQKGAKSILYGEELEQILICLGRALSTLAYSETTEGSGDDWMLFTAAEHWNWVRSCSLWPTIDNDKVALCELNIAAARISISYASYKEAAKLLRFGIDCFTSEDRWGKYYDITIELYNLLMDTEFSSGNFDLVREYIGQVLEHATTMQDKGLAYVHSIGIIMQGKDRDHALALKKGIAILEWHGVEIMADPENVDPLLIEQEELRCSIALGGRRVVDLLDSPPMEDETVMRILERMAKASVYSGKVPFAYFLGQIAIQICAENGISEFLPRIYMYTQMYLRKQDRELMAYDCAVSSKQLVEKLPNVSAETFCTVTVTCCNGLQLLTPTWKVVDVYQECYKKSIRAGDTEFAFLVANSYGLSYYLSGVPITAKTEEEFYIFEKKCQKYNQPPSVYSTFRIYRQLALNLQGRSENTTKFDGSAMTEEELLSNFEPDTPQYKQTLRDLSSCKMMAACIFGDLPTMEAMIENQKSWPDFDILLHRLNMRLLWQALGAFVLARAKRGKEYGQMGQKYLKLFKEKSKHGNPNANVAFLCLQAEHKQSKKDYNSAIEACRVIQSIHLEALMNENCGLYQLKQKKLEYGRSYLTRAYQLYHAYGAIAKLKQMNTNYTFLKAVRLDNSSSKKTDGKAMRRQMQGFKKYTIELGSKK